MRYEYGWQRIPATGELIDDVVKRAPGLVTFASVEHQPTKALAEDCARDWVISPLRTGIRRARTVRRSVTTRNGRTEVGMWTVLDRWQSPEAYNASESA